MKLILTFLAAMLLGPVSTDAANPLSLKTVVIDAGHGGKDPGAVAADGKTYEKTFVLEIAKLLEKKIKAAYPDVKVIMTRSDDTFVTLNDRAQKANKVDADLFISIHINSSSSKEANGYSIHVLGQSHKPNSDLYKANLEMVKRENSVVLLDDDYNAATAGFDPSDPQSYIFMTMMQSAFLEQSISFAQTLADNLKGGPFKLRGISQDPFYVLWKTSMPSVLVELGFLSNDNDLKALKSSESREDIAQRLFESFKQYKTAYDRSTGATIVQAPVQPESKPQTAPETQPQARSESVRYGVQIFTVVSKIAKGDYRLMGYEPLYFETSSGKYRHVIAVSPTKESAIRKMESIKSKYPDCYLVKIEGTTASRAN